MTKRTEVIQLRVSTEEKERINALATAEGMKVSDFLRQRGLYEKAGDFRPLATTDEVENVVQGTREQVESAVGGKVTAVPSPHTHRCPKHPETVASSPNARCFCNRKTSEAV